MSAHQNPIPEQIINDLHMTAWRIRGVLLSLEMLSDHVEELCGQTAEAYAFMNLQDTLQQQVMEISQSADRLWEARKAVTV